MEMSETDRAEVAAARRVLDSARDDLDAALAALPDVDNDKAMATPMLLALLLRTVEAKDQLKQLEVLSSTQHRGATRD